MTKPNKFEKAILDAAIAAQEFHIDMTGGKYLWYSHESFLQNFIAVKMFKNKKTAGHYVYVDASPKKIRKSSDSASEEDEKDPRQRFDLVFWFKSKNEVKAIVEIKATWGKKSVMGDICKVSKYLIENGRNISGYVLYYTDHKGQDKEVIQDRFYEIIREQSIQKVELRANYIRNPRDRDPWGFALFRVAAQ